jgi:hypothetical protein
VAIVSLGQTAFSESSLHFARQFPSWKSPVNDELILSVDSVPNLMALDDVMAAFWALPCSRFGQQFSWREVVWLHPKIGNSFDLPLQIFRFFKSSRPSIK